MRLVCRGVVQGLAPVSEPGSSNHAVQQSGNLSCNNVDDRDGIKKPLVNGDAF
jgi:hypothetical protein